MCSSVQYLTNTASMYVLDVPAAGSQPAAAAGGKGGGLSAGAIAGIAIGAAAGAAALATATWVLVRQRRQAQRTAHEANAKPSADSSLEAALPSEATNDMCSLGLSATPNPSSVTAVLVASPFAAAQSLAASLGSSTAPGGSSTGSAWADRGGGAVGTPGPSFRLGPRAGSASFVSPFAAASMRSRAPSKTALPTAFVSNSSGASSQHEMLPELRAHIAECDAAISCGHAMSSSHAYGGGGGQLWTEQSMISTSSLPDSLQARAGCQWGGMHQAAAAVGSRPGSQL